MITLYLACIFSIAYTPLFTAETEPVSLAQQVNHLTQSTRDGDFSKIIDLIVQRFKPQAEQHRIVLGNKSIEILQVLFSGPQMATEHKELFQQITKEHDDKKRAALIRQAEEYRSSHPILPLKKRKTLLRSLRTAFADYKARNKLDAKATQAIENIINSFSLKPTSVGDFITHSGPSIALGLYHTGDGYLAFKKQTDHDAALTQTDPVKIHEATSKDSTGFDQAVSAARLGIQSIYGLMPLVSWEHYNDATKHSLASKIAGLSHLTARVSALLHRWLYQKESEFSVQQATILSQYTTAHGQSPQAIELAKKGRMLARIRLALRILGQGVMPGLFAHHYDPNKHTASYTSPGLLSANISGFVDAVTDLVWRIYRLRTIRMLKQRSLTYSLGQLHDGIPKTHTTP